VRETANNLQSAADLQALRRCLDQQERTLDNEEAYRLLQGALNLTVDSIISSQLGDIAAATSLLAAADDQYTAAFIIIAGVDPSGGTIEPPQTNGLIVMSFDDNPSTQEAGTSWGRLSDTSRIDIPEEYMTISNCPSACGWWTFLDDQYSYSDYECIAFEAYTSHPGGEVTVQIDFKVGASGIIDNPRVIINSGTWTTYSVPYSLTDALDRPVNNINQIAFLVTSNTSRSSIHIDSIRLEDCPQQNQ
jgi:hypothetical protein